MVGETALLATTAEQSVHGHRFGLQCRLQPLRPGGITESFPTLQGDCALTQGIAQATGRLAGRCRQPDDRQTRVQRMVFTRQGQQHAQYRGGLSGPRPSGQHEQAATKHLLHRPGLLNNGLRPSVIEQGMQIRDGAWRMRQIDSAATHAQVGRDSDFMQGIAAQIEMIELKHKWRGHHRIFGQRGDHRFSTQCFDLGGTQCAKPMT